jgi:acyl carrier protein
MPDITADITADITGDLVDLVERITEVPEVTSSSRFDTLGNWTSLAALRLLADIEDHFGVKLDLRTYFSIADVGQLSTLVAEAVAGT